MGAYHNRAMDDFLGLEADDLHCPGVCSLGGSQPSGSTNTVTNNTPWSGQTGYLTDIYAQAQNLDQTVQPQYYPGNTYAPMTGIQNALMSGLIGYGAGGGDAALNAANANTANTLSPGYTGQTQNSFDQGTNVLNNEMSSSYLNPWNSPSFGTVVNNTLASVMPGITSSFTGGNRSDSGLATRAATMGATDAVGNLAQSQYNTNQGIQNAAVNTASNNLLTQQGNQIKSSAVAPIVDQMQGTDLSTALGASGMAQTNQQNQINANIAAYNYGQMAPWNQLSLYENAIAGAGSPGGSSTTTAPYFSNPMANVTSAATGLGSLGLMAYLALSDRNLKTDIHKIGKSSAGDPLYMFRYIGEKPGTMHIGLMAQDVEKRRPDAVVKTPVGLAVDYIKALAA